MRKAAPILVLRLALLVALLACAVLFVEYENAGDPAFCGAGSGCMAVRRSMYSHIVLYDGTDVALPVLGLCAVAGLLALSVVARDKSQTFFVAAAAAGGGIVALVLVGIQAFVIGAFCKWCLLVDGSLVVAAGAAALVHFQTAHDPAFEAFLLGLSQRRVQVIAWLAGAAVVGGLPFLWGEYPVLSPLPPAVAALSVPGKLTIVSFTDFECPFCRKLAPVLHEVQENWGDRVVVVRRMAPLSIHPGALPAALAYVCTPPALREDLARRLYAAPPTMLTRGALPILARDAGADQAEFEACMDGNASHDQVTADRALFESLNAAGVPYTFIGPRAVAGFNPEAVRKFGAPGEDGERISLHLSWMVLAAAAVAALLTAFTLRSAPRDDAARLAPT